MAYIIRLGCFASPIMYTSFAMLFEDSIKSLSIWLLLPTESITVPALSLVLLPKESAMSTPSLYTSITGAFVSC